MRFSPRTFIIFSGLLWLAVGIFLLSLGSSFILKSCHIMTSQYSLAAYLGRTMKDPGQCAVVLLSFSLFLGYLKGRFVLSKAAHKQIERLLSLPRPLHLKQLYTRRYYFLLGGMIGLGMLLRYLPVSLELRGIVDVAVGMALTTGALQYFRRAFMPLAAMPSQMNSEQDTSSTNL